MLISFLFSLKQVQIIPWVISDSNYVRCPSYQLDPAKTVFVGALHGMLSAEGLANIMNDLFGGVVYSGTLYFGLKIRVVEFSCVNKYTLEMAVENAESEFHK